MNDAGKAYFYIEHDTEDLKSYSLHLKRSNRDTLIIKASTEQLLERHETSGFGDKGHI